jgi:GR25 family glycosyltransferase involved in LPS biosynthesis
MWEFIDRIIYINLDHREDRRQIMNRLFKDGHIPVDKVERFSAIRHPVGIVGCAMGHIAILKKAKANGWKNILIMEDDMEWSPNFTENYETLKRLLETGKWDACMIAGLFVDYTYPRVRTAFCTNAYIVSAHYYDTLLENFETGLRNKLDVIVPYVPRRSHANLEIIRNKLIDSRNQYNVDTYWFILQERDSWLGLEMCKQLNTYSDIYNSEVNHELATPESMRPYVKYLKSQQI